MEQICCDLKEFQILYQKRSDPKACEQALALYQGLLFYQNCYDWIAQWEAYYDLRYMELLECMAQHREISGNKKASKAYLRYLEK